VWTTTDTCSGTTISDQKDVVLTSSNQGQLALPPLQAGESVEYRCGAQPPVSQLYCVAVLASVSTQTVNGKTFNIVLYTTGLSTLGPDLPEQQCVQPPGATTTTCTSYPLAPPDVFGYRQSIVSCAPEQGPGDYAISWRLGGVQLGPPLIYRAPNIVPSPTACTAWLGNPSVGPDIAPLAANVKQVNEYALPTSGTAVWMFADLVPAGGQGAEQVQGVVYADASGAPGALVGATMPVTITPASAPMEYQLAFPQRLPLQAGNYWLGLLTGGDGTVAGINYSPEPSSTPTNSNEFSAGPNDPFGPIASAGDTQMSLYVFYLAGN
jgi:hypothetical protein